MLLGNLASSTAVAILIQLVNIVCGSNTSTIMMFPTFGTSSGTVIATSNSIKGLNSSSTSMPANTGTFLSVNYRSTILEQSSKIILTSSKSSQTSTLFVMSTSNSINTSFPENISTSQVTAASSKMQLLPSVSYTAHDSGPTNSSSVSIFFKIMSESNEFSSTTHNSFFFTSSTKILLSAPIVSSSFATSSGLQTSTSQLTTSIHQKINSSSSSTYRPNSNISTSPSFPVRMLNNASSTLKTNTTLLPPTPEKSSIFRNLTSSTNSITSLKSNNYTTSLTLITETLIVTPSYIIPSKSSHDSSKNLSFTFDVYKHSSSLTSQTTKPLFGEVSLSSSFKSFIFSASSSTHRLSSIPFVSSSLMASSFISSKMSSNTSQTLKSTSLRLPLSLPVYNTSFLLKRISSTLTLTKISSSMNRTFDIPESSAVVPTATFKSVTNRTLITSITLSHGRLPKSSKTTIPKVTPSSTGVVPDHMRSFWEVNGILVVSPNKKSSREYNDLSKKNDYKKLGGSIERILDAALTSVGDYIYSKVLVIKSKDKANRIKYECMFKQVLKRPSSETASTLKEKIKSYNDTYGFGEFVLHSIQTSVHSSETSDKSLPLWTIIVIAVLGSVCFLLLIAIIYTRRKLNKSEYERSHSSPRHDNNSNSRFKGFFPNDYDGYDASSNIPLKLTSVSTVDSKKSPKPSDTVDPYSGGDGETDDEKESIQGSLIEGKDDGINIEGETSLGNGTGTGALQIQDSSDESVEEDEAKFSTFSRKR